ncbi:CDC42 small effector protein 1-like [Hippopotamus amphibius kiboko]|uniref:CDC42 small effector protein 1-like n=1 Tax=Hippopotamus amphibius kiboko TaxID=575201 RepID=UPI0025952260|nr:CDC42 small effector protein 1-like [Hippopotamus amphibius kiboko]
MFVLGERGEGSQGTRARALCGLSRGVKLEPSRNTSEFWHKLGCCVVEKPQPKKKRRRTDRAMTGQPMNFVHLTHTGSGEMEARDGLAMTGAAQEQMRSKGNRDRPWSNSRGLQLQ